MLFTGAGTWNGNISSSADAVINTNGGARTINGVISGVNLTKLGSNALTLNAANTFTGNLNVNAGTVVLANANTYTGATTVLGGAANGLTLNGFGTILNTSGVTVNALATFLVDNSAVAQLDQPPGLQRHHHAQRRHLPVQCQQQHRHHHDPDGGDDRAGQRPVDHPGGLHAAGRSGGRHVRVHRHHSEPQRRRHRELHRRGGQCARPWAPAATS